MEYKAKNYSVDALQFTSSSLDEFVKFTGAALVSIQRREDNNFFCIVNSLGVSTSVNEGEFLIKGVRGDFTVIKAEDFNSRYELVK